MSGKRLRNRRSGDRSEYMATFGLSRFSFVYPAPRQEDFGVVDLLCVLTAKHGNCDYPENGFYVQIKSNDDPIEIDVDAVKWIRDHMDLPLLICVADKDNGRLSFFSTAFIWVPLFKYATPKLVRLHLDGASPGLDVVPISGEINLPLGKPIFSTTLDELEKGSQTAYAVLQKWISLDGQNIAVRKLGRGLSASVYREWVTNSTDGLTPYNCYLFGSAFSGAEAGVAQILTALAHCYRDQKQRDRLAALRPFLGVLRPYLDAHGIGFADGTLTIDD